MLVDGTWTNYKVKVHVSQIFQKDDFCHFWYFYSWLTADTHDSFLDSWRKWGFIVHLYNQCIAVAI